MAAGDRIFMAKESTSQEILSNTKKIIEDAKAKPKRYGMRINLLDSNPATRVKYLYDAVGMTPAGMNFAGGGFDYGDWGDILILSILVDTFISKISFPMQPGPEIGSISDA